MVSLGWRLLPYVMVLGGLFLLLSTLPVIINGAETAPTAVALSDVSATSPEANWLKVTGGGLYLPDAIVDEQIKKSTGARKPKAWYVPLVPEAEAVTRAKALVGRTTQPAAKQAVFVRFKPDEFLRNYPTPEKLKTDDVFRPVEVEGLRASNVLFPARLKDYIRAELQLPVESVVIVDYGNKPLQRDQAVMMAGIMASIVALGVLWIRARFRRPDPTLPVAAPLEA